MDFAVLTSPLVWVARQWLRFLTGLVIIAAALGVGQPGVDGVDQAADRPATIAPAAAGAVAADTGAVRHSSVEVPVEPDPIVAVAVPARVHSQRPASVAIPASVDVSPVGQRAPPALASAAPTV